MSTAIPLEGGGYRLFTKGASEMVLRCCTHILDAKAEQQVFGKEDRDNLVNKVIEPMASFGLRTIGIAYRDFHPGKWLLDNVQGSK